jgi:GR25 family glycosyltransferase involved in LPS biosynthesis
VINLAEATDRWQSVSESHRLYVGEKVPLSRLTAADKASPLVQAAEGKLTPAEKGCLLSHVAALRQCASLAGTFHWIAEDDVAFGPSTLARLGALLSQLARGNWDILFTDVMVAGPASALDVWGHFLSHQRRESTGILDLSGVAFGGTTSYIVNARSIPRILALVEGIRALDTPWDLLLRRFSQDKKLSVLTTLPFLTRASRAPSQIQAQTELIDWWSALRDLMFCDADVEATARRLDELTQPATMAMLFGRIMGGMVDPTIAASAMPQRRIDSTALTNKAVRRSSVSNKASSDSTT